MAENRGENMSKKRFRNAGKQVTPGEKSVVVSWKDLVNPKDKGNVRPDDIANLKPFDRANQQAPGSAEDEGKT